MDEHGSVAQIFSSLLRGSNCMEFEISWMEEEGNCSMVQRVPASEALALNTEIKPRGSPQTTTSQKGVTWTPAEQEAGLSKDVTKAVTNQVTIETATSAAAARVTWTPIGQEDMPSEDGSRFGNSLVPSGYIEKAGAERECEYPLWALLYQDRYRPW